MTTSPPWNQLPVSVPVNGVTYWICQYRWYSLPYKASWVAATLSWSIPAPFASVIPWYVAPWWRAV